MGLGSISSGSVTSPLVMTVRTDRPSSPRRMIVRKMLLGTLVSAVLLPLCGCDFGGGGNPGVIPENQDPKAARAFIEGGGGVAKPKVKPGARAQVPLPPQPPK